MASAVLPSQNEHYWSEREVCLRQFTSNPTNNPHFNVRLNLNPNHYGYRNPIYNPTFSLKRQISDLTVNADLLQSNEPSPRPPPVVINDAPSFSRNKLPVLSKDSFHREHVTFHLSSYSKSELKELKMRLISELERVRAILTRMETRELELGRGFLCPQFSLPAVGTNQQSLDPPTDSRAPNGRPAVLMAGNAKKNQKFLGQKRALALADGRETKRPVVAATEAKALASMMKKCKRILTTLMTHRYGYVFNKPVDVVALKLHDYYEIIKHPMDLGTVKSRLNKRSYKSPFDFAADVRLTFGNAMNYNPKGSHVHKMAESMLLSFEKMFGKEWKEDQQYEAQNLKLVAAKTSQNISWARPDSSVMMPKEVEGKLLDYKCTEPTVLSSPSFKKEQASLICTLQSKKGKLPKPKAKDPNKRKMTLEEKANLGLSLQSMPLEKMEQMVHIVRKRNPKFMQETDDEVEIDIEALDNETLWDLDRFVSNHLKKAAIKTKRQVFCYDAITLIQEGPNPKSSVSDPHQEMALENSKKVDAGEEDVDIGEDIPPNDFPHVEIEKDPVGAASGSSSSSSSCSSSDGSSTSDSDSGSVSESDSDEDSVQSPCDGPKGIRAAEVY